MRFRRIDVRSYRAIDHAEVELGPGLNVLYGPNDLGKSTLASAMRAALLLPFESSAHQAFLPWHDAGPPKVRLTLEHDGTIYRVTKVFGSGSIGSAHLESSLDGSSFHEEEKGRAVDRRLRELLRWGIEAPGGKGGARGLPESFLSHVLLGNQSDVPLILDRNLEGDRDGSGRERLHDALAALSQDPVFKRVLGVAQAKVDAAFTPTGRRRTGQSSPLAPIKEQITQLVQEYERLSHQRRETEEVQLRIASLDEQRLRGQSELEALEARVAREAELLARAELRQRAVERVAVATRALAAHEAERTELAALEAELSALRERAATAAEGVALELERRTAAEAALNAAERAVGELSSEAALENQSRQRAELEADGRQKLAERAQVEEALGLRRQLAAAEAAVAAESQTLVAAEAAEAQVTQALTAVAAELARLTEIERVVAWREAALGVERGRAAHDEATALVAQASELRARAATAEAAGSSSDVPNATLAALRALRTQIDVATAQLQVGLGLVLRVPSERELTIRIDGGPERAVKGSGKPLEERGKSRIAARISGGIELEASAGDPALQAELDALERRWAAEAEPLLAASGSTTLEMLAERVEAGRVQRRERGDWLRQAEALESRAAEKSAAGADLALLEQRAEQRRKALGALDPALVEQQVAALVTAAKPARGARSTPAAAPGAWDARALEALLESRRAEAAARRARLDAELPAASAARVRALTRMSSLSEARDALVAEVTRRAEGQGSAPVAPEVLQRRLGELERAAQAATAKLDAWEKQRAAQAAELRRVRDQAARALGEARQRHEAAQAASGAGRERAIALETRVLERKPRLDPSREAAARQELEQARLALSALADAENMTAERLQASRAELERAGRELDASLAELRRAEGALGHVGGDVVAMRERETAEALERARAHELDREREYDAYKLLLETMRTVENEQGAHLGRALEAPVSERFERLTEGRYREVGLDAGLGLAGVAVAGRPRAYGELSEGTQEQLATILRLCIAEYLDTALVLDDHLAQTHKQRAEWFRTTLRESAARIQIVVLTARPEDYLTAAEMCDGVPCKDSAPGVRAIDLERVIRRARYGATAATTASASNPDPAPLSTAARL